MLCSAEINRGRLSLWREEQRQRGPAERRVDSCMQSVQFLYTTWKKSPRRRQPCVPLHRQHGTRSNSRDAWEKTGYWLPLLRAALCYFLAFLFSSSFPSQSLREAGWEPISLRGRSIKRYIVIATHCPLNQLIYNRIRWLEPFRGGPSPHYLQRVRKRCGNIEVSLSLIGVCGVLEWVQIQGGRYTWYTFNGIPKKLSVCFH